MRCGGVASVCLALSLLAGSVSAHFGGGGHSGHQSYWTGGYVVSGFPHGYWGPYYNSGPLYVSGLNVYGPAFGAGAPFPAAGPIVGGGPIGGGGVGAGVGGGAGAPAAAPGQGVVAGGGQGAGGAAPGDFQPHGKPKPTNTERKARAGKFIQYGDAQFVKQKYNSALERYRDAASAAPDLAEVYFRQAFALVGSNQYESAKKALDRGLRTRPNWPDTNFDLSTLYGPKGHLAKTSHREALASAIEQNPQSADLLVLMGVMLYCDGERERSRLFFDRAIDLGANENHLFDRFIAPRPGDADPAAQVAGRGNI